MYQKKIEKLENHHIIPVSCKWPWIKENLASISATKHAELHSILDMNSRMHYRLVREARDKTNHRLIIWPEDLKYWHDVQDLYFERVPRLDWFLKKVHLEKMNQLVQYESGRLEQIWIIHKPELCKTFESALDNYHELGIELAKEIQFIFKKGLEWKIP